MLTYIIHKLRQQATLVVQGLLSILLISLWMTSHHDVFGESGLLFHGMVSSGSACCVYGPFLFVANDQITIGGVS